jgi:hypothetical protein
MAQKCNKSKLWVGDRAEARTLNLSETEEGGRKSGKRETIELSANIYIQT